MKTVILSAIILLNLIRGNYLNAQAPEIEWQKSFGGSEYDNAFSIQQTSDTGYIVAGDSWSGDGDVSGYHGSADYWVVKLDEVGIIQWTKAFGGSGADFANEIKQTADGGYIVVGSTISTDGDITAFYGSTDIWLLKLNSDGDLEWQKSYGGSDLDDAESIEQSNDGGYIIAGRSSSTDGDVTENNGEDDFWVIKLDAIGNIEWERSLGGSQDDFATEIHQTLDGGYIAIGTTESVDGDVTGFHDNSDYWIVKLNAEGTLEWEHAFGGYDWEHALSISQTLDGGFIAAGYTQSNDGDVLGLHGDIYADYWVIRLNSIGSLKWQKCLGGDDWEQAGSILQNVDSNFIVAGYSSTNNNGDVTGHHGAESYADYWIVALDTLGVIQWQKSIGGTSTDEAFSIVETIDTGYIVAGWSFSNDGDVSGHHGLTLNRDYWVVKLRPPCDHIIYYEDYDGDGFGNPDQFIYSCFDTIGYVLNDSDCNDTISEINPEAKEICNAIDDNCNELIDEDLVYEMYFIDEDGDDFGNSEIDSLWCASLIGFVIDSTDCDDTNPNIYPGAEEILNGLDDDCDGLTDENLAINNALLKAIKIYPNPAETILHIEYSGIEGCRIEIYSLTGEVIYQNELSSSTIIDISKFVSGIYFLKIMGDDGEVGVKVVKE